MTIDFDQLAATVRRDHNGRRLCGLCNRRHTARGLCRGHYDQHRYGLADPDRDVFAWLDLDRLAATDTRGDWRKRAGCAGLDTALFFPESSAVHKDVLATCDRCPVRYECLADQLAATHGRRYDDKGIWGGTNKVERDTIRKALAERYAA